LNDSSPTVIPSTPPSAPIPPPERPVCNPLHTSTTDSETPLRTRTLSRERRLTEKGVLQAQEIEAQKEHLLKVRSAAAEHHRSTQSSPIPSIDDSENPFSGLCDDGVFNELPSTLLDDTSFVSLDVEDYLQRDVESICEATLLSIHSDIRRDPRAPGYDLTLPPSNHNEAMLRPDANEWRKVEEKEFGMLKEMKVYVEEMLPEGRKAIGSRWVFEFKIPEENVAPTPKGRLVAQGYSQVPFVDYDSTFAPVAKSVSIRLIAVYSTIQGWHLECFDATRAFLWGDLSRLIFLRYPQGYQCTLLGGVWHLLKSLYGLKQASRVWYKLLQSILEKLGFVRSEFDHAVFVFNAIWSGDQVHCILAMHVDDGLAGCNSASFLAFIKAEIGKAFGIKDLGPLRMFLGVQFEHNLATQEIWIHQELYINALLEEYQLVDCNTMSTPLDPHHPFGLDTDVFLTIPNLLHAFQRLVGSLLFLQQFLRLDLSQTMLLLSQFCSNPEPRHFTAAKRVLRYLKGTKSLRLHYGGAKRHEPLTGLTDADWANNRADRISVSGYVWFLAGGPISWSLKKQNSIALSSTEAEYVAMTRAVQEGIWLRASFHQLHIQPPSPLVLSTDNNAALSLAENDSSHSRAKHIDIHYHFIHSHVEHGDFLINHVPGVINSADLFTKLLSCPKFQEHVTRLGMVCR
jgi:hypothetical protein